MADLPNVNIEEIEKFKEIAGTSKDCSIIMLNLNEYSEEAKFPNGELYKDYMKILNILLTEVGGKILWQTEASATLIGNQKIHEALGIWYPSHQAFLDLITAPSSEKNMKLRKRKILLSLILNGTSYILFIKEVLILKKATIDYPFTSNKTFLIILNLFHFLCKNI